jgi:hypothetical protein
MLAELQKWPQPEALDTLAHIGVKYILVHTFQGDDFEQQRLPGLLAISRLKLVGSFPTPIGNVKQIYVFELQQ